MGKLRKCLFRKQNWGPAPGTEGSMENKTCRLDPVSHREPWPWKGPAVGEGQFSVPLHTPQKATVAKQMALHIFKPLFNTVTFFACLLFMPLVKSPTSCHHLEENVRGLWLPVPLLSSAGEMSPGTSASCGPGSRMSETAEGGPFTKMNHHRGP